MGANKGYHATDALDPMRNGQAVKLGRIVFDPPNGPRQREGVCFITMRTRLAWPICCVGPKVMTAFRKVIRARGSSIGAGPFNAAINVIPSFAHHLNGPQRCLGAAVPLIDGISAFGTRRTRSKRRAKHLSRASRDCSRVIPKSRGISISPQNNKQRLIPFSPVAPHVELGAETRPCG